MASGVPAPKRTKALPPAPSAPPAAGWPADLWGVGHAQQQSAVMSTEQVLNLIDCLGGERLTSFTAPPAPAMVYETGVSEGVSEGSMDQGAAVATLSRKSSALALALEPFGSIEDSFADFPDSLNSPASQCHTGVAQSSQVPWSPLLESQPRDCALPLQHSLSLGGGCSAEMDSLSMSSTQCASVSQR